MTKIDIFSGFLGAGKTTLIKKLIKEAYGSEKLVLIENEFGEIGIDGAFMHDAGIEVTEMNSGCICCSLVGDFSEALKKVLDTYSPDRILIEPSGVGKLSDVIRAVSGVCTENTVLNSRCTVVDAVKCKMYMKNFGEFFNDQIESASCIILSHTDNISDKKLDECVKLIRSHNSAAQIVAAPWKDLDGKAVLDAAENSNTLENDLNALKEEQHICPECGHVHEHEHEDGHCCHEHEHEHEDGHCCHEHDHEHEDGHCCHEHEHEHEDGHCCHEHEHDHHHAHHHADDVFTSWGAESAKSFTKEQLHSILSSLDKSDIYGTVLRAKGIVSSDDCWLHFDYVPGEIDIRTGSASVIGRICVIGSKIDTQKLETLFNI